MKVGIAADHGGFTMKTLVVEMVKSLGHEVVDYGTHEYVKTDDYPDLIIPLAEGVSKGEVERGSAVCGSGVGACVVANKVKGVRAALITETYSAHQGVEHDALNIMCIGGRVIGQEMARELVEAFLSADFSGEERHERRLNKVLKLEEKW
ncbi:MAG: RpiB/LacA/LacB family sugar-phosphate isomerase [Bacteroidota bacterium]